MKRIALALFAIFALSSLAHAQAPATDTLTWTNPAAPVAANGAQETLTGAIILRANCTGAVTGATQPDGAIVGQCSAASAFSELLAFNFPNSVCTPATSCFIDNALTPCLPMGCVYEVEIVTTCATCTPATATSAPSTPIAVSWNAPAAPPAAAPASAPTNPTLKAKHDVDRVSGRLG